MVWEMRRGGAAMAGVAVLVLVGCAGANEEQAKTTVASPSRSAAVLGSVVQDCQAAAARVENITTSDPRDRSLVALLADQSMSITLTTHATKGSASLDGVQCILKGAETPDHVQAHITSTRAIDGTQEDEWEGFAARWTYHPDSGLNITVRQIG